MSSRDFTHHAYANLLTTLHDAGFEVLPFGALDTLTRSPAAIVLLRHDVDRLPARAVAMGQLEHRLGFRATYFIRVQSQTFPDDAVAALRACGHEIGYHYEDLAAASGVASIAWETFQENLAALRRSGPVNWIAMHGRPLSGWDSRLLWQHYDYATLGLREAYADIDWQTWRYFTDTGRGWNRGVNVRDHPPVPEASPPHAGDTRSLALRLVRERRAAIISAHPERWAATALGWVQVLAVDTAVSLLKSAILRIRRARPGVSPPA